MKPMVKSFLFTSVFVFTNSTSWCSDFVSVDTADAQETASQMANHAESIDKQVERRVVSYVKSGIEASAIFHAAHLIQNDLVKESPHRGTFQSLMAALENKLAEGENDSTLLDVFGFLGFKTEIAKDAYISTKEKFTSKTDTRTDTLTSLITGTIETHQDEPFAEMKTVRLSPAMAKVRDMMYTKHHFSLSTYLSYTTPKEAFLASRQKFDELLKDFTRRQAALEEKYPGISKSLMALKTALTQDEDGLNKRYFNNFAEQHPEIAVLAFSLYQIEMQTAFLALDYLMRKGNIKLSFDDAAENTHGAGAAAAGATS